MEKRINEHIVLKLDESNTYIYVSNEPFLLCKKVLFQIEKFKSFPDMDHLLEYYAKKEYNSEIVITPEEEFWVHCSNLEAWYLNDYDTSLLDSRLSFPLLKSLTELGDIKAKKKFKEELAKRVKFATGAFEDFFLQDNYLENFNQEELLEVTLIHNDAVSLLRLAKNSGKKYRMIRKFGDLRDIFLDLHFRNEIDLRNEVYYYSRSNRTVKELEMLIDWESHTSFPIELFKFKNLQNLMIWINHPTILTLFRDIKFKNWTIKLLTVAFYNKIIKKDFISLVRIFNKIFPNASIKAFLPFLAPEDKINFEELIALELVKNRVNLSIDYFPMLSFLVL